MKVKNQHQEVIHYLKNYTNFSLADIIMQSMFYKFQTRLSEIESHFGTIATRRKRQFTNKFGRKSTYNVYNSCVSNEKLIQIHDFYS